MVMLFDDNQARNELFRNAQSPLYDSKWPLGNRPIVNEPLLVWSQAIMTPGRIGFYIDYSELTGPGIHRFYVCRTHGSTGRVTVDFDSAGDSHIPVSGTLVWEDTDLDIKTVEVAVPNKTVNGIHSVRLVLSNPTGGAELHLEDQTYAIGRIDDGTIAPESDAVFYDADAAAGGNGTMATPYNSIYTARDEFVSSNKMYLYGRGITVIDDTENVGGHNCIWLPTKETSSEDDRVYVMAWPGYNWEFNALTEHGLGWYSRTDQNGQSNYITFRDIEFSDFVTTDAGSYSGNEPGGIVSIYGSIEMLTVEYCNFRNIESRTNTGGINVWGANGVRVWRCSITDIRSRGEHTNGNAAGIMTYDSNKMSVQRCYFSGMHVGIYQKRVGNVGDVTIGARFNVFDGDSDIQNMGVLHGASGLSGVCHDNVVVQGNVFINCSANGARQQPGYEPAAIDGGHWYVGNVFVRCAAGESSTLQFQDTYEVVIANNIFLDCRKTWGFPVDDSDAGDEIRYIDYNHEEGTTLTSQIIEFRGVNYNSVAAFNAAFPPWEANASSGDPLFVDSATDFRLAPGSPCIGTGMGGVDKGVYLTGIEEVGI